MITEVRMQNVRGTSTTVQLGKKTVLTGPNGSGKTSVSAAIQLAVLGYIPGYDKKGVFANSSDPKMMAAGVTIDGRVIDRAWKLGKTLSESVSIDGVTAGRNSADAMIQMALGRDPLVFDVKAFFASTATEQRRTCLELVMPAKDMQALMDEEARKRDAKNAAAARRRDAQSVVNRLVESRTDMGAPTGNIVALREEETKLRTDYDALVAENATAIENDRLRAELKVASDDEITAERVRLDEIQKLVAPAESKLNEVMGAIEKLGLRPKPTGPSDDEILANDEAEKAEKALVKSQDRIGGIPDGERFGTFTPAGRARLTTIRVSLQGLHDHLFEDDDSRAVVTEILSLLNEIYPDEHTMAVYKEELDRLIDQIEQLRTMVADKKEAGRVIMKARIDAQTKAEIGWDQASRRLEKDRIVAQADVDNVSAAIREQNKTIAAMIAAADKLKGLGSGVDPNVARMIEGMGARLSELRSKIDGLAEFETLDREIEKARLALVSAEDAEVAAKVKLDAVVAKQQAVVQSASDMLETRSQCILPSGALRMIDNGKDISIVWVRDGRLPVHRHTLSGGEQAVFDPAAGYALAPKGLVIIEAAEVDDWPGQSKFTAMLEHLADAPCDLLVMTCHRPASVPEPWILTEMR